MSRNQDNLILVSLFLKLSDPNSSSTLSALLVSICHHSSSPLMDPSWICACRRPKWYFQKNKSTIEITNSSSLITLNDCKKEHTKERGTNRTTTDYEPVKTMPTLHNLIWRREAQSFEASEPTIHYQVMARHILGLVRRQVQGGLGYIGILAMGPFKLPEPVYDPGHLL